MDSRDELHASSHWKHWGALGAGWGTQARFDPAEWAGSPLIAITSPQRWRVLSAFPEAIEVSRRMGLAFTQDTVRQLCSVELLSEYFRPGSSVLTIGDGFGVLGGLIRKRFPRCRISMVDLSFTLREQEDRLTRAFGRENFDFVHADDLDQLGEQKFDVAVNVASMQEMDPPEVARYFSFMRGGGRVDLFYCCNRENKILPDGTVSAFKDYPWSPADEIIVDGVCPWHQFFVSVRFPFIRRYDGVHLHRLVRLAAQPA